MPQIENVILGLAAFGENGRYNQSRNVPNYKNVDGIDNRKLYVLGYKKLDYNEYELKIKYLYCDQSLEPQSSHENMALVTHFKDHLPFWLSKDVMKNKGDNHGCQSFFLF